MKRRGIVTDVADPDSLGRIRVKLVGFDPRGAETDWCWPCSPLAGAGYGFFCLPQVGDEVFVEQTAECDWVWTGFFWSGRRAAPAAGTPTVRVFRTPAGHQVKFDESGDVEIADSRGSAITLRANGDIELLGQGDINLVNLSGGVVNLSGPNGEPVPMGDKLEALLEEMISTFNSHTHMHSPGDKPPAPTGSPASSMSYEDMKSTRTRTT